MNRLTILCGTPPSGLLGANKPYLVPASDQTADSFTVPLSTGTLTVNLPLASNTLKVLRPLVKWLQFTGASSAKKEELLKCIAHNLSLLPMEEAVARWPQLGEPIPEKADLTLAAYHDHMSGSWSLRLQRETPQFIPHLFMKLKQLQKAEGTQHAKEFHAWIHAGDPPKWREDAMDELDYPLRGKPHYEITVEETVQDHDGYCSGAEGDDWHEEEIVIRTLYLQADDWTPADLNRKVTWQEGLEGHDYCSAGKDVRMLAWKLVNE